MRILQVVHQRLPTWVGGVEVYTHGLAQALLARGHAVEVFVREAGVGGLRAEVYDGVPVQRFLAAPRSEAQRWLATFGDPECQAAYADVLARFQPDVVHFQHLLGLPAALLEMTRERGLPAIVTLHDYWFVCANTKLLTNYNEQVCGGPRAWVNCGRCGLARAGFDWASLAAPALAPVFAWRDRRLRQVLRRATALIAPTEFVRDTYRRLGAPADRLLVLDYGIAPPPAAAAPLRAEGPLRVAYLGAIARLKGVHVLVEAFQALPPDAQLWIAGDMDRQPEYGRRLRQMARHPGIRFLGQQGRAALWELLDWADLVAVPSIWYEVSPLVVHEAFAMRRPVIASGLGSLAGCVRDGQDGLLAPPGEPEAWSARLAEIARDRRRLFELQAAIRPVRTAAQQAVELETLYAREVTKSLR